MNEDTRKRMNELAKKFQNKSYEENGCGDMDHYGVDYSFEAGYTAAHNDAQGEIEKLKAELTEAKEKRLSSVRNDLRAEIEKLKAENSEMRFELEAKQRPLGEQVLELTLKLQQERAASAELLKALEMYFRIENSEHEVEVDVLTKDFERLAKKLLAAHHARQKDRG